MKIRKAQMEDLSEIQNIYASARAFMAEQGNGSQWGTVYPPEAVLLADIEMGDLYVVEEESRLLAVFFFKEGDDPTYRVIYDGKWLSDEPYAVIHRVAVGEKGRGIIGIIIDYCYSICPNLRIDTHINNFPMRRAVEKRGFKYCGIIHIASGDERIAFQKV